MAQYDNEFRFEMLGQPVDIGVYLQDEIGDTGEQIASYGGVLESYLENYATEMVTWSLVTANHNAAPMMGSISTQNQKIIIAWGGVPR